MSRFRVYVLPFDDAGAYLPDYIEVTKDVASIGNPKQSIDNTDFDVGVIRNNGLNITLRNDQGYYSDVDQIKSIFRSTRKNSLVKITWDIRDYDLICGFFYPVDQPIGGEVIIFEGLINDVSSVADIAQQQATFACLGFESLIDEMIVPFSSINNGDLFSDIIQTCLDQSPLNELVNIDGTNFSLGTDMAADDVSKFENETVGSILKNLLLAANSVLFLRDAVDVIVSDRTASDTNMFTFYGQAATSGIENVINIPKFSDGMNRVINYWTWDKEGVTVKAQDTTSVAHYGALAKAIATDLIADGSVSKIQTILNANRDEFSFPKIELDIETPMDYDTLALNILDRVNINYPTIYIPYDANPLPRYGQTFYDGTARYPYGQWALTIQPETSFKIMQKTINVSKQTITFHLREV